MRYKRSQTEMDQVSRFFPQNFLGRLGQFEDYGAFETEFMGYGTDPVSEWPSELNWGATPPFVPAGSSPAPVSSPAPAPSNGFNWGAVPTMLRDLLTASSQADYSRKITEINLERARRGQPPLNPQAYAPRVLVGTTPETMRAAQIGAGTLALGALAVAFLLARRKRR
jgi:hypothetical protein